jgi:hypothetical protein
MGDYLHCLECLALKRPTPSPPLPGRPWCAACAPENSSRAVGVIHGYYLAASGTRHWDPELSEQAHRIWMHYAAHAGRDWYQQPPGQYDGASAWKPKEPQLVKHATTYRRMIQDFSPPPPGDTRKVRMTPYDLSEREVLEALEGDRMTDEERRKFWEKLWEDAVTKRHALEAGIRGNVSFARRRQLEDEYQAAHKKWWDAVSGYRP